MSGKKNLMTRTRKAAVRALSSTKTSLAQSAHFLGCLLSQLAQRHFVLQKRCLTFLRFGSKGFLHHSQVILGSYSLALLRVATLSIATLALSFYSNAQVSVAPMQITRAQFLNGTGVPLAGGCVTFNAAGTSTPQAIYADNTGTFQLPNPLTLDAAGEASVWLSNASYDITAYTGVPLTSCSVSLGTQQWQEKNKNIYAIITQSQNFFLNCGGSDPVGVNGELACRSDLGKMRFFFGIWDSVVTEATAATLTNKIFDVSANVLKNSTNTSGNTLVSNGTQYVDTPVYNPKQTYTVASSGLIPFQGGVVKFTGSPSVINATSSSDTGGAIGICVSSNCGTPSATATVQTSGSATCVVDNAFTSGDYVTISNINTGGCHDAGSAYPNGVQVLGRITSASGSGTAQILLFPAEIKGSPIVYSTASAATTTSIGAVTMFTPTANSTYRFSIAFDQTLAGTACTTNSTYGVSINWTDPNDGASSDNVGWIKNGVVSNSQSITNNGVAGNVLGNAISYTFRVKAATAIQYAVSVVPGANCAPAPTYQVFPILEQMSTN